MFATANKRFERHATCWCRHMRRFNEVKSVASKVGAGETASRLRTPELARSASQNPD